ncbi:hypothetical protein N7454_011034 [Penicillium verhagenii]|nr:hypothetical protein N7454_011034 [Penicillium verhagenii]
MLPTVAITILSVEDVQRSLQLELDAEDAEMQDMQPLPSLPTSSIGNSKINEASARWVTEIDMTVLSQVRDLISSFHQVPNVRRQFRRMYTSEGTLLSKYFHILDFVDLDPVLKKSLRRGNAIYETSKQHLSI